MPHNTEPLGFAEWLAYHCERSGRRGPRPGTSARAKLARMFAEIAAEGYSPEEFRLATDGVLADDFMVTGGFTKPENVLRKTKIAGRVDDGLRARAVAERGSSFGLGDAGAAGKYDAFSLGADPRL